MRHKFLPLFLSALALSVTLALNAAAAVTVGAHGNEPLITIGPDGTLYISALQHLYRSTDNGATWKELGGPIYASTLNLNSDSSISVDPENRLYFTFDYPYAGSTAVCTSDDHGDTWTCNPAVVPGGTDRMWTLAPSTSAAYEVTNEGLYETTFLSSGDRGLTWVPRAVGSGLLEPQTGPLLQKRCSNLVLQVVKIYGNSSDEEELKVYVYDPTSPTALISDVRGTGLKLPLALPSASFSGDGVLYVASEEANPAGGRQVVLARSNDEGVTWTKLPPLPQTKTGTSIFTWVAAGEPGHIGVLYYYTPSNGDPGAMTDAVWAAVWAETRDANSAVPSWTFTTVDQNIHTGPICIAADCMGSNRFAGDFISSIIDSTGAAHLTWMRQDTTNGTTTASIRYTRIQSGAAATFVPAPCTTPTPTATPSATPTASPSATPTPSPSSTPSPTATPTASPTATATPSASPSSTPGATPTPSSTPTPTPGGTPGNLQLVNISGRSRVQTAPQVAIAGFIVNGDSLKRVMVRGLGPSIEANGRLVPGTLQDPILELRDEKGGSVTNDNWRTSQRDEIEQSGLAPKDDRESAIIALLPAGKYTAILRGVHDTTGIGLVEVFDLNAANGSQLGNLSVRADVLTGDDVLIDGVIVRGGEPKRVLFRAIGPELHDRGVTGELQDPALELHDANGGLMAHNDSWRTASNASEIQGTGLAPKDDREPAILLTLTPGNYTSIVRGVNNTTGVALGEAYKLD
ncbi:MAG: hypothetical protein ACJ8I9_07580 [Chthoniobacterales bacterium]